MRPGKTYAGIIAILLIMLAVKSNAQAIASDDRKYYIVDLSTGKEVQVHYDTATWQTIDNETRMPVDYYVINYTDTKMSPDTVHGITGLIVNDLLWKNAEGKWMLNDARVKWDGKELKMKDKYGRKVKWEAGELKIKDWNSKYKSEKGDDAKYKQEWDKIKWKDDELKVETGAQKVKAAR